MKHTYNKKPKILSCPLFLTRIAAFFKRKKIIILTDNDGDVYYTLPLSGCECGKTHCHVYWETGVGDVILNEDGTISEDSNSLYLKSWKYYGGK